MFANQDLYVMFKIFDPMASATTYGQRPTFVGAKQWAMVEGENWVPYTLYI